MSERPSKTKPAPAFVVGQLVRMARRVVALSAGNTMRTLEAGEIVSVDLATRVSGAGWRYRVESNEYQAWVYIEDIEAPLMATEGVNG